MDHIEADQRSAPPSDLDPVRPQDTPPRPRLPVPRAPVLVVLLFLAVALLAAAGILGAGGDDRAIARSGGAPSDNAYMDSATYNGSTECGLCHELTHEAWQKSFHPKKMRPADSSTVVGDWATDPVLNVSAGVTATPHLTKNGTSYYIDIDGTGSQVLRVDYVLGGLGWKQEYVVSIGRSKYVLPIQWNLETRVWVGVDAQDWYNATSGAATAPPKSQAWDRRCAGCHATGVEIAFEQDTGEWVASYEELGIGCEACHGPGSLHINPPEGRGREEFIWDNISSSVCGNCHIRGESVGMLGGMTLGYPVSAAGKVIRPGDPLDAFFVANPIDYPDGETSAVHRQQYYDYITHNHSRALGTVLASAQRSDTCLKCHSTDYRLAPLEERPTLDTARFSIECVACHDPHGPTYEHMLRLPQRNVCIQCHQTFETPPGETPHHPQKEMLEGSIPIPEITGEPWMGGVYICTDCHMPKVATNAVSHDTASHSFYFISPEKSLRYGMPNSCTVSCHEPGAPGGPMTDAAAAQHVRDWKAETQRLLVTAGERLAAARAAIDAAEGHGFAYDVWNASNTSYNKALLARDYVKEDGTLVHNHPFALQLLNFSISTSEAVVRDMAPGTIKGNLRDADGNAVEGAQVRMGDITLATTGTDGSFEIRVAPGKHTFKVYEGGKLAHTFDATSPPGGQTTDLGVVSYPAEAGGNKTLLTIILAVAVAVAIVAVAALMVPRRGKK